MARCKLLLLLELALLTFAVINVLLEASRKSLERVGKHTDAALLLIEPDMLSYTPSMVNLFDTTQTTLSNTLLSI
jgi:hypothetical protein